MVIAEREGRIWALIKIVMWAYQTFMMSLIHGLPGLTSPVQLQCYSLVQHVLCKLFNHYVLFITFMTPNIDRLTDYWLILTSTLWHCFALVLSIFSRVSLALLYLMNSFLESQTAEGSSPWCWISFEKVYLIPNFPIWIFFLDGQVELLILNVVQRAILLLLWKGVSDKTLSHCFANVLFHSSLPVLYQPLEKLNVA